MLFLTPAQKTGLYAPAFLREGFLLDLPEREPFRHFFERSRRFPGINQDLYLDLKTYLADDIMVKVDRMSMAASLEARAPLLDRKLVEFAFSLPPDWKVGAGTGKWFFKKAMAGILDEGSSTGKNRAFPFPSRTGCKDDLKELMLETLSEKKISDMGYFSYPYVQGHDPRTPAEPGKPLPSPVGADPVPPLARSFREGIGPAPAAAPARDMNLLHIYPDRPAGGFPRRAGRFHRRRRRPAVRPRLPGGRPAAALSSWATTSSRPASAPCSPPCATTSTG